MDPYPTIENWTAAPGAIAPADGNSGSLSVIPSLPAGAGEARNRGNEYDASSLDPSASATKAAASTRDDSSHSIFDLGPNNERLEDAKPELVHALRELVRQYREEGVVARRHEIRRIRQARLFWQGLQYAWWNPNDMNWHLPFEQRFSDDRQLEEMPRYQFVTNFYQGFGLSFIAVLSQDVPSVRFYPQSAQSLEDIGAARAASDVADLIEQNNHVEHLLTSIGYFLWTDGKLGATLPMASASDSTKKTSSKPSKSPSATTSTFAPTAAKKFPRPVARGPWPVRRNSQHMLSGLWVFPRAETESARTGTSLLKNWDMPLMGIPLPRITEHGTRNTLSVRIAAPNSPPPTCAKPNASLFLVSSALAASRTARKSSPSPAASN
jgi:hypothetical protein